jgi:hypothetical protein
MTIYSTETVCLRSKSLLDCLRALADEAIEFETRDAGFRVICVDSPKERR